jgi:hypothetical protein
MHSRFTRMMRFGHWRLNEGLGRFPTRREVTAEMHATQIINPKDLDEMTEEEREPVVHTYASVM